MGICPKCEVDLKLDWDDQFGYRYYCEKCRYSDESFTGRDDTVIWQGIHTYASREESPEKFDQLFELWKRSLCMMCGQNLFKGVCLNCD